MSRLTVEDVVFSLDELTDSITNDPGSWENLTLERYLEAMHAWLRGKAKQFDEPLEPSWEFIVEMLQAAKVYE